MPILYVIQRNRVLEAGAWSNTQIDAERRRDKEAKAVHYSEQKEVQTGVAWSSDGHASTTAMQGKAQPALSIWSRFKSWFAS